MIDLIEKEIAIEDLLLDPNNPRFRNNLQRPPRVPDELIEEKQSEILGHFSKSQEADDPEFDVTNIKDLYDSMLRIGYVGIDRIVVRPLATNTQKYLVVEGNRRIATVKTILADYESKIVKDPKKRRDVEKHMATFKRICATFFDTKGLAQQTIDEYIAVLLGIRHHGSLLVWEPLPKAFNIYSEYMTEEPRKKEFSFENLKATEVANRLCIGRAEVIGALHTYVAFLQARERFQEVQDHHFSLIEYGILDRHLKGDYFKSDPYTLELDEPSLTRLNALCQFSTRDSNNPNLTTNGKRKILSDPKQFKVFGKLIHARQASQDRIIREFAEDLIRRVENEEDLETTLDRATDNMIEIVEQSEWVKTLRSLLSKQADDLPIDKYTGDGDDRGHKDDLKKAMENILIIMGIK